MIWHWKVELLLLVISLLTVLFTNSSETHTHFYELVRNGDFSHSSAHWMLNHRTALWTIEDAGSVVQVQTEENNPALKFEQVSEKFHAAVASQYVDSEDLDIKQIRGMLRLSFMANLPREFKVMLDIQYMDGSIMNAVMPAVDPSPSTFKQHCWQIPDYGSIKSAMLHLVLEAPTSSGATIDDVSLKLLPEASFTSMDSCQLYLDSYPKRRQITRDFLLPSLRESFEITIATQLTLDRLDHLVEMVTRWQGPISAVVFMNSNVNQKQFQQFIDTYHKNENLQEFVTVHLVFEDQLTREDTKKYPVNFLRNVAISLATTPHVMYLDVDLIPSFKYKDCAVWLKDAMEDFATYNDPDCESCAFIMPTFHQKDKNTEVPDDKEHLLSIMSKDRDLIHPFGGVSHSSVRYKQWETTSSPYEIHYKDNMEPYFIVSSEAPLMNYFYAGYGRDKCAYSHDLHDASFRFFVLPNGFLVNKQEKQGSPTIYTRAGGIQLRMFLTILYHHSDVESHGPIYKEDFLNMIKAQTDVEDSTAYHDPYSEEGQTSFPSVQETEKEETVGDSEEEIGEENVFFQDKNPVEEKAKYDTENDNVSEKPSHDEDKKMASCEELALHHASVPDFDLDLVRGHVQPDRKDVLIEDLMNTFGTYLYVELPSTKLDGTSSIMLPMAHPDRIILVSPFEEEDESIDRGFYWFLRSRGNLEEAFKEIKKNYPHSPTLLFLNALQMEGPETTSYLTGMLRYLTPRDILVIDLRAEASLETVNACVKTICLLGHDVSVSHLRGSQHHFLVVKHISLTEAPKLAQLKAPEVKMSFQEKHLHTDVVLITKNRPMQTLALLESVNKHVTGISKMWIVQRADNEELKTAYSKAIKCANVYFDVEVLVDNNNMGNQVIQAMEGSTAPCFMLLVDEIIWLRPADLKFSCNVLLQNDDISTFQFRLGKTLGAYPSGHMKTILEERLSIVDKEKGLYVYYPYHWPYDFGYVLHIDGFFTRREQLLNDIKELPRTPNSPGAIENGLISKHLHKYISSWHLMYSRAHFVNNMFLQDGRVAGTNSVSSGTLKLLKKFQEDKVKIDVDDFEEKYKNRISATHPSLKVSFTSHKCD